MPTTKVSRAWKEIEPRGIFDKNVIVKNTSFKGFYAIVNFKGFRFINKVNKSELKGITIELVYLKKLGYSELLVTMNTVFQSQIHVNCINEPSYNKKIWLLQTNLAGPNLFIIIEFGCNLQFTISLDFVWTDSFCILYCCKFSHAICGFLKLWEIYLIHFHQ
jgi:hypothetical protein